MQRIKKFFSSCLIILVLSTNTYAQRNQYNAETDQLKNQLTNDFVAAGISVGATLSGALPLALAAGFLTKYVVTYGIGAVKQIVEHIKGYPLQDLGLINLYHVYLIHSKRNLYKAMINIRESVKKKDELAYLNKELDKLEDFLNKECVDKKCEATEPDIKLVNQAFVDISMNARELIDMDNYLDKKEIVHTYHYLMLLYMDVLIAESQLSNYQVQVLSNQIFEIKENLESNDFLSPEEKEYQYQLAISIAANWKHMSDKRLLLYSDILTKKLGILRKNNSELSKEIKGYENENNK